MTKKPRGTKGLTTLDDFLESEGIREAFQAVAIKEVQAWEISRFQLAARLRRRDEDQ